jgi:hypothetical protein
MASVNDAQNEAPPPVIPERFRLVRELGPQGGHGVALCAALESLPDSRRIVVVERVSHSAGLFEQDVASWASTARNLVKLEHPNVVRARELIENEAETWVVGDFIDGVRWSDLVASPHGLTLDLALRVLLDVLAGLGAVHNLRDANRLALKLVHGGVTADSVIVGADGIGRVAGVARFRAAGVQATTGLHYSAPEVLLEDDMADARADV